MTTTLSPTERDALLQQFEAMEAQAPFHLLTPGEIRALTAMESPDVPIVSLYLDLGPAARQDRKWATVLKTLARDATAASPDARAARHVTQEVGRIEAMLDQRVRDLGRGLALFTAESLGLWHEVALPLALPNRLRVGSRAYLRPLFRVMDEHDRFLIVLVDDQRARIFISQLGFIVEVADLVEEGSSYVDDQNGWARVRLQRQRDAHVQSHAGTVAHAASLAMDHFAARWMLLAGTPDVVVDVREQLPQAVASRLGGEFKVALAASTKDVAKAAAPIQRAVEAREELATIERLGNARSGGRGVWGLEDTLQAIGEGRVMTLVVQHDYRAPGGVCVDSGVLTANPTGLCPHCGEAVADVGDVVEMALERAYQQGADLEMVRSEAGLTRLGDYAPIGALLRF
jgi:peptide subunit release factor 1 (eRF1)